MATEPRPSSLRIGDAEREAAAASLREHYAHGRLGIDEFQQRLDAVYAAKTDADIARITSDLPLLAPPGTGYPASSGPGPGQRRRFAVAPWATVALALLVIFLAVGLIHPFGWFGFFLARPLFLLIMLLVFGRGVLRRATRRRQYGRRYGRRW
ncbi:MAG TPA: DUF1707 domain-containing protein [Streptosporangiaceae bacterium]|nr:DUF1707 domain-containing protein [Streptosporangiaceae bacterium]